MKKYYALETSGMTADLYIFGDITSYPWKEKDKDAYSIVKELSELKADTINVHINSYGGEVSEGLAIHNCLKNSTAKIVTYCDGFACSAASVVFMAGDERIMNEASLLLIHNAWTYASGNAEEFRKQAEDLEKITQASVNAYMSRVNISEEELKKLADAGRMSGIWFCDRYNEGTGDGGQSVRDENDKRQDFEYTGRLGSGPDRN